MPSGPAIPSSKKKAWNFWSIARARIFCAGRRWIIATASPAPAFTSRTRMLPGLAAAAHLSKQHVLLENESLPKLAGLDGSGLHSLRGRLPASAAKKQPLRLVGYDSAPHWICLRGVARQLLHFLATGAPGELSHPQEAAQNRTEQTLRIDRRARRRIPHRQTTLRSLHRHEPDRAGENKRGTDSQLHPEFPAGPRPRTLRRRAFRHHGSARAERKRRLHFRHGRAHECGRLRRIAHGARLPFGSASDPAHEADARDRLGSKTRADPRSLSHYPRGALAGWPRDDHGDAPALRALHRDARKRHVQSRTSARFEFGCRLAALQRL